MKVKDLKEKLEQFDEDKEVFITLGVWYRLTVGSWTIHNVTLSTGY